MNWEKNILECNIYCVEDGDLEEQGIATGNLWLPFMVDLNKVVAVKSAGNSNDKSINGKAVLYCIDGDCYVIDIPYEEMALIFKEVVKQPKLL